MIALLYDTWKYNFLGFRFEIMAFISEMGSYQNTERAGIQKTGVLSSPPESRSWAFRDNVGLGWSGPFGQV